MAITLLLARALDPAGFAWAMVLLIPLGFMANVVPLTPGGLGVGEAAFDGLFRLAGFSGGAELLLAWRLLTVLPAAVGLVVYFQAGRRFVGGAVAVAP
jgi:uncharacterized membrane protein YbhN (UPF0104 family)